MDTIHLTDQKLTIRFWTQPASQIYPKKEREFDVSLAHLFEKIGWTRTGAIYLEELEEMVEDYIYETIRFFCISDHENFDLMPGELTRLIEWVGPQVRRIVEGARSQEISFDDPIKAAPMGSYLLLTEEQSEELRTKMVEAQLELNPSSLLRLVGKDDQELLRIERDGRIFVRGELTDTNTEVTDAVREFLKDQGYLYE